MAVAWLTGWAHGLAEGGCVTYPVLAAAAHALPRALAGLSRPDGTVVTFTADGAGGGHWHVVRRGDGWQLAGIGLPPSPPACEVRTTVAGAVKLYARDTAAPPLVSRGDPALAAALSRVKAVLG
jgi:hypothetical protein